MCASHVESRANSTIFEALEISELLEVTSLEDTGFETTSLLEDSAAEDSAATGIGLFTTSSLHAVKDKNEKDASIASTET
ncbi:hypothetical protein B7982_11490 [Fibrobacter sp. UWB2]|nr:hypothetical protein B7982_11490 [Fibrobacter sp. UWB2]